jgi:hypothetical protein
MTIWERRWRNPMLQHKNVGYLILAHADLAHLQRLVAALPADSIKLVHLDAKCQERLALSHLPNAVALEERIPVYWGDFSIIEATLRLLDAVLKFEQVTRIILLSGSCYPIKTDNEILAYLNTRKGENLIKMFKIEDAASLYEKKLSRFHIGESTVSKAIHSNLPRVNYLLSRAITQAAALWPRDWRHDLAPLQPYFGSQWWALTRACSEYVVDQARSSAKLRHFEYCFAPDEMYFHTIVGNSPHVGHANVVPFVARGNWRVANLHVLNPVSLRYAYRLDDLAEIRQSDKLFVRKVNSAQSGALLKSIDAWRIRAVKK